MKSFVAVSLLAAIGAWAQSYTINTPPSLIQCQPAAISWVGGTAPYILAAIPGGQVSAAALETIGDNLSGTSTTWTVNLAQGTSITLKLTDANGNIAYSSPNTIQQGASNSCLNASATSAAGAAGVTSGGVSASAASASSGATSAASAASSSASGAASSATSKASSASGAASSAAGSASSAVKSAASSATSGAAAAASSAAGAGYMGASVQVPALVFAGVGAVAALL